jgi:acyl-CoA dehydrogenase
MSEYARELCELIANLAKDAPEEPGHGISDLWWTTDELGLPTIGIAEAAGGSGGELSDLLVVIRELARAGIATPIVEVATAAFAIGVPPSGTFDTVVLDRVGDGLDSRLTADIKSVKFAAEADRVVIVGNDALAAVPLSRDGVIIESGADLAGLPIWRACRSGGCSCAGQRVMPSISHRPRP